MDFLYVGLGGFLGALARYGVSLLCSPQHSFPLSTLLVNVAGCALMAFAVFYKNTIPSSTFLFFVPGFLGAFTTFSAFGMETLRLLQDQQWPLALLNMALNLLLGLGAIALILYALSKIQS